MDPLQERPGRLLVAVVQQGSERGSDELGRLLAEGLYPPQAGGQAEHRQPQERGGGRLGNDERGGDGEGVQADVVEGALACIATSKALQKGMAYTTVFQALPGAPGDGG